MSWCAGVGITVEATPPSVQLTTVVPPHPTVDAELQNVSLLPMDVKFTHIDSSDINVASVSGKQQRIQIPGRVSRYTAKTPQRRTATVASLEAHACGLVIVTGRFEIKDQFSQYQGVCVADATFGVS